MAVAAVTVAAIALVLITVSSRDIIVAPIDSYSRTSDPRTIVIRVNSWSTAVLSKPDVVEDDQKVTIRVSQRKDPQVFDRGQMVTLRITLRDPLGSRAVIDGTDGRPVPGGDLEPSGP